MSLFTAVEYGTIYLQLIIIVAYWCAIRNQTAMMTLNVGHNVGFVGNPFNIEIWCHIWYSSNWQWQVNQVNIEFAFTYDLYVISGTTTSMTCIIYIAHPLNFCVISAYWI